MRRIISLMLVFTFIFSPTYFVKAEEHTKPTIENIDMSLKEAKPGQTINFKVELGQYDIKVEEVHFEYKLSDSDNWEFFSLIKNENGVFERDLKVTKNLNAGLWELQNIMIMDENYTHHMYTQDEINNGSDYNFIVNGENVDNEPPKLESFNISPKELIIGENIKFSADIKDNDTGVESAYFYYENISTKEFEEVRLKYNDETKLWERNTQIYEYLGAGDYIIKEISIRDNAGNHATIKLDQGNKFKVNKKPPIIKDHL